VRSFHNILGERGQRLTILSLLPSVTAGAGEVEEVPVGELPGRIYQIAGGDGGDILASVTIGETGEVTTSDRQALHSLVDELVDIAEREGAERAEIHYLVSEDDAEDGDGSTAAEAVERLLAAARSSDQSVAVLGVVLRRDPTVDRP
jgi:hypothetical protein